MKWIKWEGGRLPSNLKREDRVIVKLRSGEAVLTYVYGWRWETYGNNDADIVAYIPMNDVITFLDRASEES